MAYENTVLIVDDEEIIRDLQKDILTKEGYSVCSAESAEQALEILQKEPISVIFFDIGLPNMNRIGF